MLENIDFSFIDVWRFQLFSIENHPITLGKLVLGVVLFVLGYLICRKLSVLIEERLLRRLDIDTSLRHTLRTAIFYFLIIILTLFVLRLLNVPVTVFTVLGGALALGVGFGSQNIVNNFISGLILMIERPIRVGDIVRVGELIGRVEQIGARSTRIKSIDNTHFVVPNSSFLEKNILNWTLTDDVVRTKVKVGVAYGSPPDLVQEGLLASLESVSSVLKYPEPMVLFRDFGASSLDFEVYFWIKLRSVVEMQKMESQVRFSIEANFKERGIVISYPQRDIHLDSVRPIQIEMMPSQGTTKTD